MNRAIRNLVLTSQCHYIYIKTFIFPPASRGEPTVHPAEKFVPNYFRLESHLRESIRNGDLKPGDPIPPESQLCQQFSVSRTTVRQALSRLVYDGLIDRHRGRGSFVAEPRLEHTKMFLSFEEEMRARARRPASSCSTCGPSPPRERWPRTSVWPRGRRLASWSGCAWWTVRWSATRSVTCPSGSAKRSRPTRSTTSLWSPRCGASWGRRGRG